MGHYDDQNAFLLTQTILAKEGIAKRPKKDVKNQPKFMTRKYTVDGVRICKEVFKSAFPVYSAGLGTILQSYGKDPNELTKN